MNVVLIGSIPFVHVYTEINSESQPWRWTGVKHDDNGLYLFDCRLYWLHSALSTQLSALHFAVVSDGDAHSVAKCYIIYYSMLSWYLLLQSLKFSSTYCCCRWSIPNGHKEVLDEDGVWSTYHQVDWNDRRADVSSEDYVTSFWWNPHGNCYIRDHRRIRNL